MSIRRSYTTGTIYLYVSHIDSVTRFRNSTPQLHMMYASSTCGTAIQIITHVKHRWYTSVEGRLATTRSTKSDTGIEDDIGAYYADDGCGSDDCIINNGMHRPPIDDNDDGEVDADDMDDNGSSSEAPDKPCTARHREVGSVVDKDAHICSVRPARRRPIAIVAVSRVHVTPSNEDIYIVVVRHSRIYRVGVLRRH